MATFNKDLTHAVVLQGGGALGAYQAGAFSVFAEEGLLPDYVVGISIGAINSALIVGNKPEDRVSRLTEFWNRITDTHPLSRFFVDSFSSFLPRGEVNEAWAMNSMFNGVPGFFRPRVPSPLFHMPGTQAARSFYDTSPLRETLLELVDFDLLNKTKVRLAVGAVNVETGNLIYFDNTKQKIGPEHIMASGALPPGFPPVEIDGAFYWDGGVVSNAPLQYFFDNHDEKQDSAVYQFDLFDARGKVPESVWEIESREKDIRFSSRTRYTTDNAANFLKVRAALHKLYDKLPDELRNSKEVRTLMGASHPGSMLIVHMIYRQAAHERASKDYEFSRASKDDHWNAGAADARHTLEDADWIRAKSEREALAIIDAGRPAAERHS